MSLALRVAVALALAASAAGVAADRVASTSGAAGAACPPGDWIRSETAAWVRRVVEHAGYPVEGCTGSSWIGATPLTRFTIWASEPWRRPPGSRPYRERSPHNAFTDGTRIVWEAQGLAVWVAPGPDVSDRLPGATAFGRLQAASFLVPRRNEPIRFMATPSMVLRACRSAVALAPACPTRIPHVSSAPIVRWGRNYPRLSTYTSVVNGIFGIERRGETGPDLIRPPILHIEVEAAAGRPPRGMRAPWPTTGAAAPRDGLLREERTGAVSLGRVTWGGKAGSVALAPPYPRGGSQADHVVFRWRSGRTTYLVGLHAWEPFTEAHATLRRLVASIPRE